MPRLMDPEMAFNPVEFASPWIVRFWFASDVKAAGLLNLAEALLETVIVALAVNVIGPLMMGLALARTAMAPASEPPGLAIRNCSVRST